MFEGDAEAWEHVWKGMKAGVPHCVAALAMCSREEFSRIIDFV